MVHHASVLTKSIAMLLLLAHKVFAEDSGKLDPECLVQMSFAGQDFSEDMMITQADRESAGSKVSFATDRQILLNLSAEDVMQQKYIRFAAVQVGTEQYLRLSGLQMGIGDNFLTKHGDQDAKDLIK